MEKLMKRMEDMGDEERKNLRKLLQEKSKGSQDKMDWMYKKDRPENEDYLLGRRIDKHIEEAEHVEEEQNKDAPGASFQEVMAKRADLDMQAKMREDPLYAIRQREEEARRRLLENPIKMKMLQKELKKRKKKEKKKKKARGEDSDDELMAKYLAIVQQKTGKGGASELKGKKQKKNQPDSSESDDSDGSESESDKRKHKRERPWNSPEDDRRNRQRHHSSPDRHSKHKYGYDRAYRDDRDDDRRKYRDDHRQDRDKERYHDRGGSDRYRDRSEHYERDRSNGRSDQYRKRSDHGDRSRDFANGSHHRQNREKHRNSHRSRDSSSESESPRRTVKSRQSRRSSDSQSPRRTDKSSQPRRSESPERSRDSHFAKHKRGSGSSHRDVSTKHQRQRSESSNSSEEEQKSPPKRKRHDSGTSDSQSSSSEEEEEKKPVKQYGLILSESQAKRNRKSSPQKVEIKPTKPTVQRRQRSPPRKKLSKEEMARRREEMMDNAKWRDKEREQNVKRYQREDATEKAMLEKQKQSDSAEFINPLMASHASHSSVEDRIRRNRYNVQRTKGDREAGFVKK